MVHYDEIQFTVVQRSDEGLQVWSLTIHGSFQHYNYNFVAHLLILLQVHALPGLHNIFL